MSETILHVGDSLASIEQYETNDDSKFGGLKTVIEQAIDQRVDAVVHTGNMFRRPEPDQQLVDALIESLERLDNANVPLFVIEGRREAQGDGLDQLINAGVTTELSAEPTVIGDVALYGINNTGDKSALLDRLDDLEETQEFTFNLICLHEQIWPPLWESKADVSALDVMEATNVHVGGVLAGGLKDSQRWESDNFDYWVQYPGSTNHRQNTDGDATRGYFVTADPDEATHSEFRLSASDIDEELAHLKRAIEHHPADTEDVDPEQIADLYGLAARAKKLFEQRRKELREELLDRTDEDCQIQGRYADVRRKTQQRRKLKSENAVFDSLEDAGIPPEVVTTVDSSAVRELVEEDEIDEASVFDIEERRYIRVGDVDL